MRTLLFFTLALAGCPRSQPVTEPLPLVVTRAPNTATSGPVLVLLHGLGANERDLLPLAEAVAPASRAIGLRAPLSLGDDRYSWFPVRFTDDGPVHDAAAAERSRVAIVTTLERLRSEPASAPLTLIGFSQGAMLAEEIARTRPELIDAAVLIGGRTIADHPAPSARERPRLLIMHGTRDPIVPYAGISKTLEVLQRDGFPVELKSFEAGHEVTSEMVVTLRAWLTER